MDFSSPAIAGLREFDMLDALNLAARINNVSTVERLLTILNPNCIDNRGWTCLHEAAASDSYEILLLILNHKDIRPLVETQEGHTPLYKACLYKSSIKTIRALLDSVPDIANYGNTEDVTPLHIACTQGRNDVIQLLLDYGAFINVQDFDRDTPLHDAALAAHFDTVTLLLHAGADPEIKNEAYYSAFHLACYKGCYQTVRNLYTFITDVNQVTVNGDTPLILATKSRNDVIVQFLLKNGADPNIKNKNGYIALTMALKVGHILSFNILLRVTDLNKLDQNLILQACKPNNFKLEILDSLLKYNLDIKYFHYSEKFNVSWDHIGEVNPKYLTNAPLNSFLKISEYIYRYSPDKCREFLYLFLMRGPSVNAEDVNECPPLVYTLYNEHSLSFWEIFKILREHGCEVDYYSGSSCNEQNRIIPDAILASITSDPSTLPILLPYSLQCDPEYVLKFASENGLMGKLPLNVQKKLLAMIGLNSDTNAEALPYTMLSLKHLCRQTIRHIVRCNNKSYCDFVNSLKVTCMPEILKDYLCYLSETELFNYNYLYIE